MKRFNKILALVLALTMMCGVVSICASAAADTTNAAYKIAFADNDGNPITSVAAGSTANVIVSMKTNGYSPCFAFMAIYDSVALTHIRQGGSAVQSLKPVNCAELQGFFKNTGNVENPSQDLIDHEDDEIGVGDIFDWGSAEPTATPHTDAMYPASFTDTQKAQFKCINFGYLANSGKTCLTVNTNGEFVAVVRFRFLANVDTELNSSVFYFNDDTTKTYITIDPDDEPFSNLQTSSPIAVSNLTVEYEGGVTPPPANPITVENISTQVQWQDKDAGKMRVAFRGNIKNYTLNLAGGSETEIADIAEMGVVYSKSNADPTVGGANCSNAPAWTIYDFTNGGYFFRAVVGNYQYDNAETLYAKAYIVIDGQTIYAPSAMTTTGAQAYAAGVANGMSAK